MNAKTHFVLCALLGLIAMEASAATTYVGTWHNDTFGSSGGVTIVLDLTGSDWSATLDLDGNVFGGTDPGPVSLGGSFGGFGNSSFEVLDDPVFGDVSGQISGGTLVSATLTSLPTALITSVEVFGCIANTGTACLNGGIELNYQVFFADGFGLPASAEGTLSAAPQVVPLPAPLALLAVSLGMLAAHRRTSSHLPG